MTAVANTRFETFPADHLTVGRTTDALIMRAGFAAEVNGILTRCLLRAPIILSVGRSREWIFITEARTAMRPATWADLVRIQVGWLPVGAIVPLPGAADAGDRRWLQRPAPGESLPSWSAVVSAARSASSVCGSW
jgi:hypothetical protein